MVFENRLCFVSGAARKKGNGRAIALKFAESGADVAVGDILYEDLQAVADEIRALGRRSLAVRMDLTKKEEVAEGFDRIRKDLGTVDILVNNAAIMTNMAPIRKMTLEAWEREISVNLTGAFLCIKQVIDGMAEKGWGRIISISSLAAMRGGFGQCSYAASKAGLVALTKTLALETARKGITANAITLGLIETDAVSDLPEHVREQLLKKIPVGKAGKPRQVADLAAFLASEEAGYITGANITLSGGVDLA